MNWKTNLLYWWAAKVCKFPYVIVHGKDKFQGISFLMKEDVLKEDCEIKDKVELDYEKAIEIANLLH